MIRFFLFVFFTMSVLCAPAHARLSKEQRAELFEMVEQLCQNAENVGEIIRYEGSLDAGASFKILGLDAEGRVTKEEWKNLEQKFGEFRTNKTICNFEMIKLILPIFDTGSTIKNYYEDDEVLVNYSKIVGFDSYKVGRRAREFGDNIVVKVSKKGDKYATGRVDGVDFTIPDIPNIDKISIDIRLFIHYHGDKSRKIPINIKLSNGEKISSYMVFYKTCCSGDRNYFHIDETEFHEHAGKFSWEKDDYNNIKIELERGDLAFFLNDKFITTSIIPEGVYIDSIDIQKIDAYDAITYIDINSL